MNVYPTYAEFFSTKARFTPHDWQAALASADHPCNRLIRVPTGFGKTAGTVLTWLWHRGMQQNPAWPRRLVYCLPMRVLVEQTEAEVRAWLQEEGLLWDGRPETHAGKVGVHVLMGGSNEGEWHLYPEENAILIGTQDMLLSRVLNRGYAAPRARWPMEFGLLNQDALWIADEVQLMDVGLATTAQLQQFREEDRARSLRPCFTWWMSATLQPEWLASVDTRPMVETLETCMLTIAPAQRMGSLWDSVTKSVQVLAAAEASAIAKLAIEQHHALTDGDHGRITLIVRNRVDLAVEVYEALLKQGRSPDNTRLIHSRFRGKERKLWRQQFLSRSACCRGADMILVATQVVEAGVDISAGCLITDLAPWPSLVQRFGRAARYGGHANIYVLDPVKIDEDAALPYDVADLSGARAAISQLTDVSQKSLEDFESALSVEKRQKLYPYEPRHLLLRKELDELFDTTPDLTGADLDISRFIRTGKERDCQVFWADWEGETPSEKLQPVRDALCAVPFYDVHKWLFNKEQKAQVFVWDYLDDAWRPPKKKDVYPGRLVMVRSSVGGYSIETGFTGEKTTKKAAAVPVVNTEDAKPDVQADSGENNDTLSQAEQYQTIAEHGAAVARQCADIAKPIGLPSDVVALLTMACRYHDLGKAHPTFRRQILPSLESGMRDTPDLAKAPKAAWTGPRPHGFRHELASALALMEMLARADQRHPALLGACRELIDAQVLTPEPTPATPMPATLGDELRALTLEQFNLLVYLVCAHHGKVRAALHGCPADQDTAADDEASMPIRGIMDGDTLPPVRIMDAQGAEQAIADLDLHLAPAMLGLSGRYGPSWRERTLALQAQHGPFALAWLETILRAADIRTSREAHT
jgi:CRISPR-associated endonuclease/helicase Cas3